jgi:hypothetical protein
MQTRQFANLKRRAERQPFELSSRDLGVMSCAIASY